MPCALFLLDSGCFVMITRIVLGAVRISFNGFVKEKQALAQSLLRSWSMTSFDFLLMGLSIPLMRSS
jgi:hypothetical protein